ncbi:MAG: polynucleotide kinase-phosphatase [bacterium]|nr:polynucleotide kinase-phosphatase [bacterium]
MNIKIPKLSLVVLIGPSGAGKSTFAGKHFLPTEVLSSDCCRALICDDANNQAITKEAFQLLHHIAGKRLEAGKLTVVDATNVQPESRAPLVTLAKKFHVLPVAIVFDLPPKVFHERNENRADRNLPQHAIRQQTTQMRHALRKLKREGFRRIIKICSVEKAEAAVIERERLWNDKSDLHGPFDLIGDVHGCYDELTALLARLGYERYEPPLLEYIPKPAAVLPAVTAAPQNGETPDTTPQAVETADSESTGQDAPEAATGHPMEGPLYKHPEGRMAVFLGDIVDRGPGTVDCIKLVYNMVKTGNALCVPGNHDIKLMRKLKGRNVQITHGLAESLAQIEALPEEIRGAFSDQAVEFIDGLISHYVLDDGKLVVAHAGLKENMQGRGSGGVREFCLYGRTTGETDEFGLPVRLDWAVEYRGGATVVYGHTPVPEADWLNRTINVDTGCVFGGKLTALRYPEKKTVSVPAAKEYCPPVRPKEAWKKTTTDKSAQQEHDDLLDAADVIGKRYISTGLRTTVTIREDHATAALEIMSRFAANPKWLIYLPPTMSPSETSREPGLLESPLEAFEYFKLNQINNLILEEKHMGSRAIAIICRNEKAALDTFGVKGEGIGIIYTRTGRRFFPDSKTETAFLQRIRKALTAADFWKQFKSQWVCLDCELMPWSQKARDLLKNQYAAVGAAGRAALPDAIQCLQKVAQRSDLETGFTMPEGCGSKEMDPAAVLEKFRGRQQNINDYITAYRNYCWEVTSLEDYKLAPFHILATEGTVHIDKDHQWHMDTLANICRCDPEILMPTPYMLVDTLDEASMQAGAEWWEQLTAKGGEGMVVKPLSLVARSSRGLVQPALKCRGREYLRIIYGPNYTEEENLERLRIRGVRRKRSLALREFALGIEALERFIQKEPLRRVHECVFGILALESEPLDPAL